MTIISPMLKTPRPFPEILRTTVLHQMPLIMARFDPAGFFRDHPGIGSFNENQFIYPLAYLYATRFRGNRYHRDPEILAAVRAIGDHVSRCTDARGDMSHERIGAHVDQRNLIFWLDAYGIVKGVLGLPRRRRWESAMKRTLRNLAGKLAGYMPQKRFHSRSFGTGPNHAILYAVALYLGGRALRHRPWRALAEAFADRFAAFQHPEGYWPEHDGPVTTYNMVSLAGISRFQALTPKPLYLQTLERALRYFETISYPDHSLVSVIDCRTRYDSGPRIWGYHGFTHWSRGRAFMRDAIEARLRNDRPFTGEELARMIENFVHCRRGPGPRHTRWKGTRYLGTRACFIRDKGWQVNFSVNAAIQNPNQPYMYDCRNVLELSHARTGLLINGAQDKFHPEHANFVFRGGTDPGVLYTGILATLGPTPYVEALYTNYFTGRIEVQIRDTSTVVLCASDAGPRPFPGGHLNLPLRIGINHTIRVGRREYMLTRKKLSIPVRPGGSFTFLDGKVTMRAAAGGTLFFPCRPFNPYSEDHQWGWDAAFARFQMPLRRSPRSARLTITVGQAS